MYGRLDFGWRALAIQSPAMRLNSSDDMPACVAAMSCAAPFSPCDARALKSFSSTALKGCLFFHSGFFAASSLTRSSTKASCTYIGCSDHNVPSLSKVAMRSGGGTKSGEPCLVTLSTKATMACFALPSFQDGRASACPKANCGSKKIAPSKNGSRAAKFPMRW